MKKILLGGIILLGLSAMTSCKKDWDCDCTILGLTTTTTIPDATKKDATQSCDDLSSTASIVGGSCSLK